MLLTLYRGSFEKEATVFLFAPQPNLRLYREYKRQLFRTFSLTLPLEYAEKVNSEIHSTKRDRCVVISDEVEEVVEFPIILSRMSVCLD